MRLTFRPLRWIKNLTVGLATSGLLLWPMRTELSDFKPSYNLKPSELARQESVKRVYKELAPRLFEQLQPPQIRLLSETIIDECAKSGVDPLFVLAIIETESNYEVEAISGAGARGLMQIMPKTFKGVSKARLMLDPIENVKAGITYIALLHSQGFTTPETLLHAYNQGPGNAVAVFKGELEMPYETRVHIPKVMSNYYRLLSQDGVDKKEAKKRFLVAQK